MFFLFVHIFQSQQNASSCGTAPIPAKLKTDLDISHANANKNKEQIADKAFPLLSRGTNSVRCMIASIGKESLSVLSFCTKC